MPCYPGIGMDMLHTGSSGASTVIPGFGDFKEDSRSYVMKQKSMSWGDDFVIKDEGGQDVYFIDGKVFSLGDQLSFQDMEGNELAFIRQKLLAWGPTYEIYRDGELQAVVKKTLFTLFHADSPWTSPGPTTSRPGQLHRPRVRLRARRPDRRRRVEAVVLVDGHLRRGHCRGRGRHPDPRGVGRHRHGLPRRSKRSGT